MSRKYPPLKAGDVHTAEVLRDRYGMNAANRPDIYVDPNEVPSHLRHLIPDVERWAIPCDVTRGDWFEHEGEAEVAAFYHRVEPYTKQIDEWLDTQPEDVLEWPEAAISFMYFMKAHDEAYQPTPQEKAEMERRWEETKARRKRKSDIEQALILFKEGKYKKVVALLSPYEESLEGSQLAKYKLARKKTGKEI